MNFLAIVLGFSPAWIFMFRIEWLYKIRQFILLLIFYFVLFVSSVLGFFENYIDNNFNQILKAPFLALLVFSSFRYSFRVIFKRDPENTFWSFEKKPVGDVLFTILYWLFGVGAPIILVLMI